MPKYRDQVGLMTQSKGKRKGNTKQITVSEDENRLSSN